MKTSVQFTILLIDDDPLVLKSFKAVLTREGYQVIPASSYEEAIQVIDNQTFDLVLSDIRMPGKDGVETVAAIQSRLTGAGKSDLPIIFITGYSDLGRYLKAPLYGEILSKPIDNNKLLAAIRDYL